jgi:hypothetical protein
MKIIREYEVAQHHAGETKRNAEEVVVVFQEVQAKSEVLRLREEARIREMEMRTERERIQK